jgi:MerR family transcriptional regulator, light-induced transcriptional regulator
MYTIKEAAARTGLSVPVLRAWERRYGVVAPTRTAGGYRVYDEAALGRLRAMRRLIDDGWSASSAAAAVVSGAELAAAASPSDATEPVSTGLVDRFVTAAGALDAAEIESVLDEMFATGSFERVVEDQVVPSLRALGDAWQDGRVAVAGEHVASSAVHRRLAAAFQASAVGDERDRPVLVGMPPGARHELGGLIFATAARRAGLPVVYLGADLPAADWLAAVERTRALAVVIGALMSADAEAADAIAAELRSKFSDLVIAFGGAVAPDAAPGLRSIRLPGGVRDAVAALRRALRSAASTAPAA